MVNDTMGHDAGDLLLRQWLTEFYTVCGKVILSPVSGVMNSPLCWKIFSIWKLLPVSRIKFVAR